MSDELRKAILVSLHNIKGSLNESNNYGGDTFA